MEKSPQAHTTINTNIVHRFQDYPLIFDWLVTMMLIKIQELGGASQCWQVLEFAHLRAHIICCALGDESMFKNTCMCLNPSSVIKLHFFFYYYYWLMYLKLNSRYDCNCIFTVVTLGPWKYSYLIPQRPLWKLTITEVVIISAVIAAISNWIRRRSWCHYPWSLPLPIKDCLVFI